MVLDVRNWKQRVNQVETDSELEAMRRSVNRGAPYGSDRWVKLTAKRIGRGFTIRPRGRLRKHPKSRMSPGMGQINKSTNQQSSESDDHLTIQVTTCGLKQVVFVVSQKETCRQRIDQRPLTQGKTMFNVVVIGLSMERAHVEPYRKLGIEDLA